MLPRALGLTRAMPGIAEAQREAEEVAREAVRVEDVGAARVVSGGVEAKGREGRGGGLRVEEARKAEGLFPIPQGERRWRGARGLALLRERLKARVAGRAEAQGQRQRRTTETAAEATRAVGSRETIQTAGRLIAGPSDGDPPPALRADPSPLGRGTAHEAAVGVAVAEMREVAVEAAWGRAHGGVGHDEGRRGVRRAEFDEEGDLRLELSR